MGIIDPHHLAPMLYIQDQRNPRVIGVSEKNKQFLMTTQCKVVEQAGAELGQAQLPIGIGLYCD